MPSTYILHRRWQTQTWFESVARVHRVDPVGVERVLDDLAALVPPNRPLLDGEIVLVSIEQEDESRTPVHAFRVTLPRPHFHRLDHTLRTPADGLAVRGGPPTSGEES